MDGKAPTASRNPLAYLFALFVPYAGRLGAGFGFIGLVYIIGVLAAIAIPAYQSYTARVVTQKVLIDSQSTRESLGRYYESTHRVPQSLDQAGVSPTLADGSQLTLDSEHMRLTVHTRVGDLVFVPRADAQGHVVWDCTNGEKLKPEALPMSCRRK
jgi:Tfp pilus assembly protein PilE